MVYIARSQDVKARLYHDGTSVRDAEKRVLVGPDENAPNFSMRKFTIKKGGCSPYHTHPWEHEVYMLGGQGEIRFAGGSQAVEPGHFAFVPPNEEHQFVNSGDGVFEFLCIVPLAGEDG
jgi:quercetin dioxygenase-like cupin family protein